MSNYLNTFDRETVINVLDKIMSSGKDVVGPSVSDIEKNTKGSLVISYSPMLGKIDVWELNLSKPLYPNPTYEAKLLPETVFIESIASSWGVGNLTNEKPQPPKPPAPRVIREGGDVPLPPHLVNKFK